MKNVFDFIKPKASLNRNAFDLSQRHVYSMKAGQVLPLLSIETVPGDYIEIDTVNLTRTMPVATDAFVRLKERYSWIFVPYQQLWQGWNAFISQNSESFSSNEFTRSVYTPVFNIYDLITYAIQHLGDIDMFGFSRTENCFRILDLLGYGSFYNILGLIKEGESLATVQQYLVNAGMRDKYLNAWRILAYQKACNDYFRQNVFTESNPNLFNVDDLTEIASIQDGVMNTSKVFIACSTIWYAMWKKDIFTSLFPSPQFGSVSSVDLGTFQLINNAGISSAQNAAVSSSSKLYVQNVANSTDWSSSATIDVYQLRKAEMLQRWKEDKLRAGNKTKDQMNAMFGVRPRYLEDKYSDFVGEFDANISIDEVTNQTAGVNGSPLGDIAGKGVGTASGHIEFKAQDFGVFLCLKTVVPTAEYDALGLDKNNTLVEPFDYFTPHFEDLGMEAVYAYQYAFNPFAPMASAPNKMNTTVGFAPRYLNYKTAVDKVHGEFERSGHFVAGEVLSSGSLSHWTSSRDIRSFQSSIDSGGSFSEESLYVDPHVLDSIFLENADDTQQSDQFLCNTNFIVKAVRPMSVLGLPRW